MANKRRRIHRQANQRSKSDATETKPGSQYLVTESPFGEISEDEMMEFVKELGKRSDETFKSSFQSLNEEIVRGDAVWLLSYFAYYGLTDLLVRDHSEPSPLMPMQHECELLQALALSHPLESFQVSVRPNTEKITELVRQVMSSFGTRRMSQLDQTMTATERRRKATLEHIRHDTQVIRNWGYPAQMARIVSNLFGPLDELAFSRIGVRFTPLTSMLLAIAQESGRRTTTHLRKTRRIIRETTRSRALAQFRREFVESTEEDIQSIEELLRSYRNPQEGKIALTIVADFYLPELFHFSLADFVNAYPDSIEPDRLRDVLDGWALQFGALAEQNREFFLLDNPIWHRPLVRIDADTYFCPIVAVFVSFCLQLLESVARADVELRAAYEIRRGRFLEDEVARLFATAFPNGKVYRNSTWQHLNQDQVQQYENDLTVHIDSHLIVVECKSGRVTPHARRGAEDRLRYTIDELIARPSEQSLRFSNVLLGERRVHRFQNAAGGWNEIDTRDVVQAVRLNVNLEAMGTLASRWPDLRDAGLVNDESALAPSMALSDLESVFDVLDSGPERLHYLIRRSELEVNTSYFGDELDLLAFYVDTGFVIGQTEFDDKVGLMLYGMSRALNPYLNREWTRRPARKPSRKMTKWWRDLLGQVERRKFPRWTEAALILLSVSYDKQREFESAKTLVCSEARRTPTTAVNWPYAAFVNGVGGRDDGLAIVAFRVLTRTRRKLLIEGIAELVRNQTGASRVVVIGFDTNEGDYPYTIMAWIPTQESDHGAASDE